MKWLVLGFASIYSFVIAHISYYWFKRPIKLTVFIALNDPHSYLLLKVLPELKQRFNLDVELKLTFISSPDISIPFSQWQQWALNDVNLLAKYYQFPLLMSVPTAQSLSTAQQMWQLSDKSIDQAMTLFAKTWDNSWAEHYHASTPAINHQINNQKLLTRKGHYLTASMYCCGQWFLGVDRLIHLEQLLNRLTRAKHGGKILYNHQVLTYQKANHTGQTSDTGVQAPLIIYLSLRSPYSYLGFEQAKRVSEHYNVPLKIKLLLPMMMRGLNVSKRKKIYIFLDNIREGKRLKIPFGRFTDPLGQGILNSYPLFAYAEQQGLAVEYISALFLAINVNGLDLNDNTVIKGICQNIGLDYQAAQQFNEQHDWQIMVEKNQQELDKKALWGVPVFLYQDIAVWGQDRLWKIEQAIVEQT